MPTKFHHAGVQDGLVVGLCECNHGGGGIRKKCISPFQLDLLIELEYMVTPSKHNDNPVVVLVEEIRYGWGVMDTLSGSTLRVVNVGWMNCCDHTQQSGIIHELSFETVS